MRTFKAAAILAVLAMGVGTASAGVIGGSYVITTSSGDTENPVDLTAAGSYAWAIYGDAVDSDSDDVYEPTEWKSGGPFIGITGDYSGTGGNQYGNPTETAANFVGTNHEAPEYFEWSDGTNDVSGTKTDNQTLRMQNPLGWVASSDKRDVIRNGDGGDNPAIDPDYPDTLADYLADTDYNVGTLTISVPVEAGTGTANVYFGTRRLSWDVCAELVGDGVSWSAIIDGSDDGAGGSFNTGAKTNNVLSIDFGADEDQDLLISLTARAVESDTNRRFDVQAVAVTPEPATMALLGLGGLGVLLKRKR